MACPSGRGCGVSRRNRTYLLVPAGGGGEGLGHLARCLRLAKMLEGRATFLTARLDPAARAYLAQEILRFPKRARPATVARVGSGARWDIVLIDARRTSRNELDALMEHGLVVCVDAGGEAREHAPFLVDAFPRVPDSPEPNLSPPPFLGLPTRARKWAGLPVKSVLVSFGGEDRAHLSGSLLQALLREKLFTPAQITVAAGPLTSKRVKCSNRVDSLFSDCRIDCSLHDLSAKNADNVYFSNSNFQPFVILFSRC